MGRTGCGEEQKIMELDEILLIIRRRKSHDEEDEKASVSCLRSESDKHGARNHVQIIHNINLFE